MMLTNRYGSLMVTVVSIRTESGVCTVLYDETGCGMKLCFYFFQHKVLLLLVVLMGVV